MKDVRLATLAKNLITYSLEVKPGERVYIDIRGKDTLDLGKEVISEVARAGGVPFWFYPEAALVRRFLKDGKREQIDIMTEWYLGLMKQTQCYLGLRGDDNCFDLSDVEPATMKYWNETFVNKVHMQQRVKHTRWCVLRYPNASMATLAETSQEKFEDFYFDVCNLDYRKLSKAMDPLKTFMEKTDKVRLVGPGTDLTFSIKAIPAIKCDGKLNIPDGEVFTAPVKNSINGVIQYNTPTIHDSVLFRNIRLEFKDGKIIKATCEGNQKKLDETFNIDEGARYCGEFAIGVNPHIHTAMKDILFDEKIWGSIHLTPGNCYDEAPNGNKSSLHWDLVLIQSPAYGGGEMWFDGQLVRKDGEFVHPELKNALSREALLR